MATIPSELRMLAFEVAREVPLLVSARVSWDSPTADYIAFQAACEWWEGFAARLDCGTYFDKPEGWAPDPMALTGAEADLLLIAACVETGTRRRLDGDGIEHDPLDATDLIAALRA